MSHIGKKRLKSKSCKYNKIERGMSINLLISNQRLRRSHRSILIKYNYVLILKKKDKISGL